MEPRELQESFIGKGEVGGYEFTQLNKSDKGYIYQVSQGEGVIYYEVFKKRINDFYNTITYPHANSFGKTAWTYRCLGKAIAKLNSL